MSQFFFHLREPRGLSRDELGVDFPDVETAYLEAYRAARDIARELKAKGRNPRCYSFEITTAAGEPVLELPFSETLDRAKERGAVRLSRNVRLAVERAERMTRLVTEVAAQVEVAQENLRRARDLLASTRCGATQPPSKTGLGQ